MASPGHRPRPRHAAGRKIGRQLRNSLSQGLGIEPADGGRILELAGIDATRRPQTLDISEWASIYRAWETVSPAWEEER